MADTKTTDLTALATPALNDTSMTVDVSDTSMAASGTNKEIKHEALLGLLSSNVISGLTLSNDATDASNDLDIAVGVATVTDGTAWYVAKLASALVKQLDAAWAVGTNQGGLDTGAEATSTWYHVWLIQRSDTGVVDVLFSTSATAPTMPTNYDRKRRIGSFYNSSGSVIDPFTQVGDLFIWATRKADVAAANPGTSAVLRTLSVPLGISVLARIHLSLVDNSWGGTSIYTLVSSPSATDETPSVTACNLQTGLTGLTIIQSHADVTVLTNTSSQVRTRQTVSDADTTVRVQTEGWHDPRGNI